MRAFRTSPNEISVSADIKDAVWLICQMTILAEHYAMVEEATLAKKCHGLAETLEQALKRNPNWCSDHD